jgi:hypothetical protein
MARCYALLARFAILALVSLALGGGIAAAAGADGPTQAGGSTQTLCVQPGSPATGAPCTNSTAYATI